jgi:hypothetical protein
MSQLGNPSGAYGYTDLQAQIPPTTKEFVASAAIADNTVVSISSTGTVATIATDGVAIIGVSYEAASAAGKTLQVIRDGPANVVAGSATTLGTPVIRSATTAGAVTSSATPVTGTVVGFALGASSGGRSWIWVQPGTNTSS